MLQNVEYDDDYNAKPSTSSQNESVALELTQPTTKTEVPNLDIMIPLPISDENIKINLINDNIKSSKMEEILKLSPIKIPENSQITTQKIPQSPFTVYQIKWVKWRGKDFPIITQNENGPCPLIALINALLLMEKFSIPSIIEIVTPEQLIEYIADYILANKPKNIPDEHLINYEQNVQDALALLPKLQTGLDVNIRFTGPKDFEYTPECIIFDLLNISLCHGWIIDPINESATAECLSNSTYNQIIDKIITNKCSVDSNLVNSALIAENFIQTTSHQLTYYGLCELNSVLKDDEMVVLFRNNHFCTLTKHKDNLYTLVTDQGYLSEKCVMWETLHNVEGDETFVDGVFERAAIRREAVPLSSNVNQPQTAGDRVSVNAELMGNRGNQIDNDYLVALSLQQEQSELNHQKQDVNYSGSEESNSRTFQHISDIPDELLTDSDLAKKFQAQEDFMLAQALSRAEMAENNSTNQNVSPKRSKNSAQRTPNLETSDNSGEGEADVRDNLKKKCTIS
ncbi:ubiquitin carboxyl-terminal hydrolase MINDY-2-like isoform X1 [Gordionus sp. m RMFG-2023]|uniref:ubiquitin carboxyl-terminal hydrolase MINDY-2-like isoform X1 n=1 Tax=Gordionus sp. m RMFG-2023 TaxID=3053472 RepID=UPI0031FE41BD